MPCGRVKNGRRFCSRPDIDIVKSDGHPGQFVSVPFRDVKIQRVSKTHKLDIQMCLCSLRGQIRLLSTTLSSFVQPARKARQAAMSNSLFMDSSVLRIMIGDYNIIYNSVLQNTLRQDDANKYF